MHAIYDKKKIGILLMVGALLLNVSCFVISDFVAPVSAANNPPLKLKWSRNLGVAGRTTLAPLAADLNEDSKLEIVVTGGSSYGGSDGYVTVLNGATGSTVWQVKPGGIGTHSGFDIADLNKDGFPEIIISAKNVLVLRGKDGSLYWRNSDIPAGEQGLYQAVLDIDGNGYPTIFVSSGQGPYKGYDFVTSLRYDGQILHQAFSWHPCYGGLTVGDANFDGKFELYQGDRSKSYNPDDNLFKDGGQGLHAYDAHTLELLWKDDTILCSSQSPVLADVNGDGLLDVVVADQSNDGIAVLKSADGSVLTTGGKTRKGTTQMPSHSQVTVYDVDGDGHLELISNSYSQPKIWDLYDWKLDGVLNETCNEPPKVGDVTGDNSNPDIIAVTGNGTSSIIIYNCNNQSGKYEQVYKLSNYPNVPYSANAFTLVQDVDNDGLNELIVTSQTGYVYCYDTLGPAPNPPVRSSLQFYSEYKRGAAEYVPFRTGTRPTLRDEQPENGSLNQPFNPTLSVSANDFYGNMMNIDIKTNTSGTWQTLKSYTSVQSGVYGSSPIGMDKLGTTYYWSTNATDTITGRWTYEFYKFTTFSNPPTQNTPVLNSTGKNLTCYNQTTVDVDGDQVSNVYSWYQNGAPFTALNLPFDTRTIAGEPLLLTDGFETDFDNWKGNGLTNWDRSTSQKHSGSYSAHARYGDTYLTSDNLDTSTSESITVSFWYREHYSSTQKNDNVYLQFWNGTVYDNIFKIRTNFKDAWQYYSIWYPTRQNYRLPNFRIRFAATGIALGEDLWIDDVSVKVPNARTDDYSGYGNNGGISSATWTPQGIQGGAYKFDGNDVITVPDNPSLGGDGTWTEISVEFWVKPATPLYGTRLITKKVDSNSTGSYMVGFESDRVSNPPNTLFWGVTTKEAGYQDVASPTTTVLQTGGWSHVVCTYKSGQGLAIYINGTYRVGKLISGAIANRTVAPGDEPLFIGYDGGGAGNRYFVGTLDEVRIYSVALFPQQIYQRFIESRDKATRYSTIVSGQTNSGDVWQCKVTPNDSFGDGQSRLSKTLKVGP